MNNQEKKHIMGNRLKLLRIYNQLSQKEFASKIGCTDRNISEWESGKRMISTNYLLKIQEAFDIQLSHFSPYEKSSILHQK